MRVLVTGGSGVIGRGVLAALVARGHQVDATTTDPGKLGLLQRLGAEGHVMDGLDPVSVGEVVAAAKPDVIVNQMTGLSARHAGTANPRRPDRFFAATNRLRTEGVEHLLAAAEAAGGPRVVTQSHGSFNGARGGGWAGFGVLAISYARRAQLGPRVMLIGVCGAPVVLGGVLVLLPEILKAVGLLPAP
jgi:nucleoside-diphosphate-sugar epimerase